MRLKSSPFSRLSKARVSGIKMTNIINNSKTLDLQIPGFEYQDLYDPQRLNELSGYFDDEVRESDPELAAAFALYKDCQGEGMTPQAISDLLVRMAPHVGNFIARLFNITSEHDQQKAAILADVQSIFVFKNEVIAKLAAKFKGVDISEWDIVDVNSKLGLLIKLAFPQTIKDTGHDQERSIGRVGAALANLANHFKLIAKGKKSDYANPDVEIARLRKALSSEPEFSITTALHDDGEFADALLEILQRWAFAAQNDDGMQQEVADWVTFKTPHKTNFENLVDHLTIEKDGYTEWMGPEERRRRRDGFGLTDPRFNERQVQYEINHCIFCHERDTDSCSKGMRNKKEGTYKVNPLGENVTGCPLEEKISEMHLVKQQGDNIGALALIVIDNPMCPGTGHRICNDCMRGCIYQKTEPVNIPQIETSALTDVLYMPWGFEIYSLLTRWNPLNIKRPYALPYNGKNVMVVGMGPAGYTLAHYLLNEGFAVIGIDGLKIEPLPEELTGTLDTPPTPIQNFDDIYEDLDKRIMLGFGGVAEYGITVRWDKNFLKVIYLNLLRRQSFRCYGGVRFGGTLTINDAWDLGFDHIAIASGAGKPTVIGLKNNLIRGIRKASDFLMGLQLTGAAKESSLANLQVRLPAGVIGGGLTGIDTTTELMAYYPVQVEKVLHRYEKLCDIYGEEKIKAGYDEEELIILNEFLEHGKIIHAERQRAEAANEEPDFQPLVEQWGGATMFYRKGIPDSPAYRQNHEEIAEALEEGIALAEGMSPVAAHADEYEHLNAVTFDQLELEDGQWVNTGKQIDVPLKSLFIAAGTSPNTIYQDEFPDTFKMDWKFYQRYEPEWVRNDPGLVAMDDETSPKIGKPAPFTSYHRSRSGQDRYITFYGDNHPVYAGNVVKAMASAKDGYPYVVKIFEEELSQLGPADQAQREQALVELQNRLNEAFLATVVKVNRLTPTIIEVIVRAPMQAQKFMPGQFYRVQNLEVLAPVVEDTVLSTEGIALTGAWVDKEKGLISLIALEMGSSSRLCACWQPGEQVVVMGVTGAPTDIPVGKTVVLLGGGLGNAVLFSIGKALRAAGNHVLYFAGYKSPQDLFKVEDIEAASDVIVWAVDKAEGVEPIQTTRPQDKSFVGNIIEAMIAYAKGDLGETKLHLDDMEHLIVIGSDRMMEAVKNARSGVLAPYIKKNHAAIGSINSPMQCMMKGVCAQCMCKHVDPETGEEYFVYSCYNQDQELDRVDFPNLHARLRQNSVQEKLSNLWLDHLLENR